MREIRLYGSEGGGAARSPYPYQASGRSWIPTLRDQCGTSAGPPLNFDTYEA